jgi:Sulfotransferase family
MNRLLLSIGAMKAGTTWLYDKLKQHPEVAFSYEKEVHYFAHKYGVAGSLSPDKRIRRMHSAMRKGLRQGDDTASLLKKLDWYTGYLADPLDDDWFLRLFGEATHGAQYLADFSNLNCHLEPTHWQEVFAKFPQTRILYIMRDPVKRIWSHYKYHLQFSGSELRKTPEINNKLFQATLKKDWFRRNADYAKVISGLRDVVSPENFLLIYFEDMVSEPLATLGIIEKFLGVSHHSFPGSDLSEKKNASVDVPMPIEWRLQVVDLYRDEFKRIREAGVWHRTWQAVDC